MHDLRKKGSFGIWTLTKPLNTQLLENPRSAVHIYLLRVPKYSEQAVACLGRQLK